jgi:hypothetical protein
MVQGDVVICRLTLIEVSDMHPTLTDQAAYSRSNAPTTDRSIAAEDPWLTFHAQYIAFADNRNFGPKIGVI